jgi:TrmH family RNA methyltransferase
MERITSPHNPRIKRLGELYKSREREKQGLLVMEGARELNLALQAGYIPETVFVCLDVFARSEYPHILSTVPETSLIEISPAVFEKLAYREQSDGIIAVMRQKRHTLNDLHLSANPFIIVLEAVEKPGNLGAILRTADAAQVDAVLICDPTTDLYNPNVIRSSIGCLFTVQMGVASSEEAFHWLNERGIKCLAAELKASLWYHEMDYTHPTAIIMGTEADGLTEFWLTHADSRIKIPMRGQIDSLNVSVSTAIITFEAMRQRGFNSHPRHAL